AVAVGYPDRRLGERVGAVVVASAPFDLATCRQWFADQGVTKFKWPERVVPVDALPLLPTGKPDRRALRTLLEGWAGRGRVRSGGEGGDRGAGDALVADGAVAHRPVGGERRLVGGAGGDLEAAGVGLLGVEVVDQRPADAPPERRRVHGQAV